VPSEAAARMGFIGSCGMGLATDNSALPIMQGIC